MVTETTVGPNALHKLPVAPAGDVDITLAGLDALETAVEPRPPLALRVWSATWPKLGAVVIFLLLWQIVVWSGWKPSYVLPGPGEALSDLGNRITTGNFWSAAARTLQRALAGYVLAILIGAIVGLAVARFSLIRSAVGSFITALQTMPSIVWFPLAILLFKLTESAILFVVVLGAAPSIANGVISGIDYVPPLLTRLGQTMGARGLKLYRLVVAPAALPSVVAGLKQGWAFAWRSLMAGELLVVVPGHPSIGSDLEDSRQLLDTVGVLAMMMTIFVIGVLVDAAFNAVDRRMRARRGLLLTQSR
ncbi:ABC transporter permease [Candidatus Protofrankia californiensis]|uniref:ABC transporter permease n=1 Tax=Candidatus Protofrankia californiensis TaxID=1839754 RepID=UPI001041BA41|nr:ABC transporter permease [Candidatus Protofrankia californiensis]